MTTTTKDRPMMRKAKRAQAAAWIAAQAAQHGPGKVLVIRPQTSRPQTGPANSAENNHASD